jgi:LPS-assembly lipoprotein
MSLLDRWPRSCAVVRACATLLLGLALSGCIEPLYGSLPGTGDTAGRLQTIAVDPIPGRLGHYLGNELIFGFNGTGSQVPPQYRLAVTVIESSQTPLLDTVTGYPTAANVVVNADYQVLPTGGGAPVAKGRVTALASYDRTSQRFANLRAARDAEIRSAKTLADQIRTRVAAELAARG